MFTVSQGTRECYYSSPPRCDYKNLRMQRTNTNVLRFRQKSTFKELTVFLFASLFEKRIVLSKRATFF